MTSPKDDAPNSDENKGAEKPSGTRRAGNIAPDPKEMRGQSPEELNRAAEEFLKAAEKDVIATDGVSSDDGEEGDDASPWAAGVEALAEENEKMKDQLVRTLADMENLRKRTAKEKQDIKKFAVTKFAQDLLGVCDTMERAVASSPELKEGAGDALKSFLEGIDLTNRQLLNTMEKNGIKRIEALEQVFDPNLHQAVMEAEHPSIVKGHVINVAQTGYLIEDRVLRPAMVVVSKGPGAVADASRAPTESKTGASASEADDAGPGDAPAEVASADTDAPSGANDNDQPANSNATAEPLEPDDKPDPQS